MGRSGHNVPLAVVVALLFILFYPALFLGYRLAPEASLKSEAPWRVQWGPYPNPSPAAVAAATHLGPRLAVIASDGLRGALWDPWIGGGRPGWLSSAAEGRAPLPLLTALVARHGWTWTALAAVEVALAFASALWALGTLGIGGSWPAAIGATAYALSGPVTGHLLDWHESALALGPLVLLPALAARPRAARLRVAAWTGILLLLFASGAPAVSYLALAAVAMVFSSRLVGRPAGWLAPLAGLVITMAIAVPSLWLQHAGAEPGAHPPAARLAPPIANLSAFVAPPALGAMPEADSLPVHAYLGPVVLLLALFGVFALRLPRAGFWLATVAASVTIALLPSALLLRLGITQRPLGVAALAVAVLAAYGAGLLCARVSGAFLHNVAGLAIWLLVVLSLLPPAAHQLPFATHEEAELPSPLARQRPTARTRMVAVLGMLPPDISATLGLADVRAASLEGEPHYAALLGTGRGGELTVSRALDRRTARLGARWVLEPLPLRVVSGEIFANIEVADLALSEKKSLDGLRRGRVTAPPGACRLALPALSQATEVWIECPGHRSQLDPDPALAAESDAWRWFAVPAGWSAGAAVIAVSGTARAAAARQVAWDTSGLRLVSEEHGARAWRWDRAWPLAFLATGFEREGGEVPVGRLTVTVARDRLAALLPLAAGGTGRVSVVATSPASVELHVETRADAMVVVQVKRRPRLWRATVNGRRVTTDSVGGVWTGIAVPAGDSNVVLRARLARGAWVPAAFGVLALVLLAFPWRRS
jgi:hypothetical protein